jgi:hypothetical protein
MNEYKHLAIVFIYSTHTQIGISGDVRISAILCPLPSNNGVDTGDDSTYGAIFNDIMVEMV